MEIISKKSYCETLRQNASESEQRKKWKISGTSMSHNYSTFLMQFRESRFRHSGRGLH